MTVSCSGLRQSIHKYLSFLTGYNMSINGNVAFVLIDRKKNKQDMILQSAGGPLERF